SDRVRGLARGPRDAAQRCPQQDRRVPRLGVGVLRPRPHGSHRGLGHAPPHRVGRHRRGRPAHLDEEVGDMADEYDVIIVGAGAGGGTLAHRLAPSGRRVLVLERGDWLPREVENWDATAVFVDNRYVSKDTWYDGEGTAFQPQVHYFVGGATKFYG